VLSVLCCWKCCVLYNAYCPVLCVLCCDALCCDAPAQLAAPGSDPPLPVAGWHTMLEAALALAPTHASITHLCHPLPLRPPLLASPLLPPHSPAVASPPGLSWKRREACWAGSLPCEPQGWVPSRVPL
jgi:hypothetical protein